MREIPNVDQPPIDRAAFARLGLSDESYAAVCRIIDDYLADPDRPYHALQRCAVRIGGRGTESIRLADGEELLFVDRCDTYAATLCFTIARGFFVSSWGSEYEAADAARTHETGEIRCAYCSEWADPGEPCGACGHAMED